MWGNLQSFQEYMYLNFIVACSSEGIWLFESFESFEGFLRGGDGLISSPHSGFDVDFLAGCRNQINTGLITSEKYTCFINFTHTREGHERVKFKACTKI